MEPRSGRRAAAPHRVGGPDPGAFLLVNRQRKHRVDRQGLTAFLAGLVEHLSPQAPFSVALVSDPVIHKYNRVYRDKDRPTDVLSFPADADYLGDVLISVDTAYNQALRSRTLTLERNIRRLALHGLLHLMGYDHETDNGRMRALELRLRRRFQC